MTEDVAKPSKGPSRALKAVFAALCLALLLVVLSAVYALRIAPTPAIVVDHSNDSTPLFEPLWVANLSTDAPPLASTVLATTRSSATVTTLLEDIQRIEETSPLTTSSPSTPSSTATSTTPSTTTKTPTITEEAATTSTSTTAAPFPSITLIPALENSESCAPRIEKRLCRSRSFVPSASVRSDQWEEAAVSASGHLSGFRPLLYHLNISSVSIATDTVAGSISIRVECVSDSNAVALHADRSVGEIDDVSLWDCRTGEEICVIRSTHLLAQQIVVFELASTVASGSVLELSVSTFQSRPSVGIYRNRAANWERGRASTLGTVFGMRKARNVFPCFDLPVFQAEMELCVSHTRGVHARSNTPAVSTSESATCFVRTPRIPSYVFGFSLFSRLHSFERPAPSTELPVVEVVVRNQMDISGLEWVFNETFQSVERMHEMTGVRFPLEKLSVAVAPLPEPLQGVAPLGLVTIQESAVEYPMYLRSHSALAHELVHQWVGDVVSVASWRDICLQEGLAAYLEWLITSTFPLADSDVDGRCREAKTVALQREAQNIALRDAFRELDHALGSCAEKAPVLFHMLDAGFGPKLVPRFLRLLFQKFAYQKAAHFDDWIDLLNDAAKTTLAGDLLTSYFSRPGYPLVHVDFRPNQPLRLSQRLVVGDVPSKNGSAAPFVVPLEIDDNSAERKTRFVVLQEFEQAEEPVAASWVVADPLSTTYSRIVYSVENYNGIAACVADRGCDFPKKVLKNVVGDFCWALLKDVFVATPSEADAWLRLLQSFAASKVASGDCGCCIDVASRHSRHCKWTWVDRCQKVSLLKTLTTSKAPKRTPRGRS
ncbi:hypothetical protein QR680_013151 [Steinernema hermaphroditum]|uniref:Peptidase M1 membrane alanine aminopeptidase domain-containing protein n=1 Tax=Steinernema hermaphroditum TaxID=289476 RepID=A0AA39M136_9BILA|nr:hypothetical protein QR680_013151 [Steinernema hermaphroditum]